MSYEPNTPVPVSGNNIKGLKDLVREVLQARYERLAMVLTPLVLYARTLKQSVHECMDLTIGQLW